LVIITGKRRGKTRKLKTKKKKNRNERAENFLFCHSGTATYNTEVTCEIYSYNK